MRWLSVVTYRVLLTIAAVAVGSPTAAQEFVSGSPPLAGSVESWMAASTPQPVAPLPVSLTPPSSPPRDPVPAGGPIESPGQPVESSWSGRIDYFHWNERLDGRDFVNESGPLVTLSYVRRVGPERFRAELFGGSVEYSAEMDCGGTPDPLLSDTNYMGVRGEYDLVYDPEWWPIASLFVGAGTRFWFRDLPDATTASGIPIWGYQETWWTVFPYVGLETRRSPDVCDLEFFGSGRIGATAVTYEHVSWDDVTLYPKLGVMGQLELGLRGPRLFLSGYFEAMTWGESDVVRDCWQPRSAMITVGLRSGFRF